MKLCLVPISNTLNGFLYFALCLQQYVALCRHSKPADQGFNGEFPHERFLVYFIDVWFIPIQSTQFLLEQNRKENPCSLSASCLQKALPNEMTTQPYRHGWNMARFAWACILALGLTALLSVLIFLLFYCCEVATLLKIQSMLQDTLVDSRSLCKKLSKSLHLKMLWRRSNSSQNLKLEKAMEMFILNNPSQ